MSFSGAVWSSRPNVQVLSPTLPLFWHHTDTELPDMAARYLGALRKAIHSLERCYEETFGHLMPPSPISQVPDPVFPYPCAYTCIDTSSKQTFTYLLQMGMGDRTLLFAAEAEDGSIICVKFVRSYSKEAHVWCASAGFAPKLKGYESVAGGWYMVVMENITQDYCQLRESKTPGDYQRGITHSLFTLHQAGYVHGDVRDINIMVRRDGSSEYKFVDFDWSGKIDEVVYPRNLFRGPDLWRPDGARDGLLIQAEHDVQMLEKINWVRS